MSEDIVSKEPVKKRKLHLALLPWLSILQYIVAAERLWLMWAIWKWTKQK